jgi:hypothetical protein
MYSQGAELVFVSRSSAFTWQSLWYCFGSLAAC